MCYESRDGVYVPHDLRNSRDDTQLVKLGNECVNRSCYESNRGTITLSRRSATKSGAVELMLTSLRRRVTRTYSDLKFPRTVAVSTKRTQSRASNNIVAA